MCVKIYTRRNAKCNNSSFHGFYVNIINIREHRSLKLYRSIWYVVWRQVGFSKTAVLAAIQTWALPAAILRSYLLSSFLTRIFTYLLTPMAMGTPGGTWIHQLVEVLPSSPSISCTLLCDSYFRHVFFSLGLSSVF